MPARVAAEWEVVANPTVAATKTAAPAMQTGATTKGTEGRRRVIVAALPVEVRALEELEDAPTQSYDEERERRRESD
jgi:hypothetical protein